MGDTSSLCSAPCSVVASQVCNTKHDPKLHNYELLSVFLLVFVSLLQEYFALTVCSIYCKSQRLSPDTFSTHTSNLNLHLQKFVFDSTCICICMREFVFAFATKYCVMCSRVRVEGCHQTPCKHKQRETHTDALRYSDTKPKRDGGRVIGLLKSSSLIINLQVLQ